MKRWTVAAVVCCWILTGCDPTNAPKSAPHAAFDPSTIEMKYKSYPGKLEAGHRTIVVVSVQNRSGAVVPSGFLVASYLWWNGTAVSAGQGEVALPELQPQTEVDVQVPITAPLRVESTLLKIDLMTETGRWISDEGAFKPLHYKVDIVGEVQAPSAGAEATPNPTIYTPIGRQRVVR